MPASPSQFKVMRQHFTQPNSPNCPNFLSCCTTWWNLYIANPTLLWTILASHIIDALFPSIRRFVLLPPYAFFLSAYALGLLPVRQSAQLHHPKNMLPQVSEGLGLTILVLLVVYPLRYNPSHFSLAELYKLIWVCRENCLEERGYKVASRGLKKTPFRHSLQCKKNGPFPFVSVWLW